jgi:phosphotriesterase-related protein
MSRNDECRGKVQTVEGLIDPDKLGVTLMHEHLVCDVTPPGEPWRSQPDEEITLENTWDANYHWNVFPGICRLDNEEVAVTELAAFRSAGGGCVVEVSSLGMSRNPEALRRIALRTGLKVVMGCGYYEEDYLGSSVQAKDVEEMVEEMIVDVREGVPGSKIKAGIIGEIGCSHEWSPLERRIMLAAIRAQAATGASLCVHPYRDPQGPGKIIRFIEKHGGDPSRTIMGHLDRRIFDLRTLLELAETGCGLGFDYFGNESSYYPFQPEIDLPNDGMRLHWILELAGRGRLSQVVISQDICTKTRLRRYGGHGYAHLLEHVVPLMRMKQFQEDQIHLLLVENPRRFLALC